MLRSMTAFASAKGAHERFSWAWEVRSVNGKGLDLRIRVPDWIEGLEAGLRARLGEALDRGNVMVSLRLQSEDAAGSVSVNARQLNDVLSALALIDARARERGLSLTPASAAEVLLVRGVLETGALPEDTTELRDAILADFEDVLASFVAMREAEGKAMADILAGQLDDIARLTDAAAETAQSRQADIAAALQTALARVLENSDGADPDRVAQELALIAVKADVTEEIDRLRAHVAAARDLLAQGSPIGRKLDFLTQEFNREANTLCSKAQNSGLTAIGLDLKAVIDQMREQVQNIE